MKPAAFDYLAPRSRAEALAMLRDHGDTGKVLAGGQSLVPAMNFRLARPEVLIDINRLPDLDHLRFEDGRMIIGGLVRHARFEHPAVEGPLGRVLPIIAAHIAHLPIRTRGTFAGSLAHADPAAEWCTLALGVEAEIVAESADRGVRCIAARDFFKTIFTTALEPDELIVETRLPVPAENWRYGFQEFSRRAGDYALAMAFAALRFDGPTIREARIAIGSVGATPVLAGNAASTLVGAHADAGVIEAAAAAARDEIEAGGDIHGSADYRRHLVGVMTERALNQALAA